MLTKTRAYSIASQRLGSRDFWRIANSVLCKSKSAIPPLFNRPEMVCPASDKAKLFPKNFSKNSNLDDSGIFLPSLPSKTNLKLHNIHVTPKLAKKVIINRDLPKVFGPDCIPVVVLKNVNYFDVDLRSSRIIGLERFLLSKIIDVTIFFCW